MVKWFEIFKTQKELEGSIPKVNIEPSNQSNNNISSLDNKKIEISYTVLLFCAMMFVVISIIIYLAGYTQSETDKLANLFTNAGYTKLPKKTNNNVRVNNNKQDIAVTIGTTSPITDKFVKENTLAESSSITNSYQVELYYGKSKPDTKFLNGLKKIVKNILNMEIEALYTKKDKIFYIILSPLNTESEASKVIELLKTRKMISKNNGKVIEPKKDTLSRIEETN